MPPLILKIKRWYNYRDGLNQVDGKYVSSSCDNIICGGEVEDAAQIVEIEMEN
jgi:hypothetical protein